MPDLIEGVATADLLGGIAVLLLLAYGGWMLIAAMIERLPGKREDEDEDEQ